MHRRSLIATLAFVVMTGLWLVPQPAEAASRPSIRSLSRTTAAVAGGTKITIHGKRLHLVKAVYFGGAKTTKIRHVSRTRIVVTAPRHGKGTVRIWLRTASGKYRTVRTVRYTATPTTANSFEAEVLRLTNQARAKARSCDGKTTLPAVGPLTWNGSLGYAARAHSRDMAKRSYFSHTSKDGTSFSTRISQTGYRWHAIGENIAAGYGSASAVVKGWLGSPGHCENIMSASYTQLGVGYATGGPYGTYWTQDFGRP